MAESEDISPIEEEDPDEMDINLSDNVASVALRITRTLLCSDLDTVSSMLWEILQDRYCVNEVVKIADSEGHLVDAFVRGAIGPGGAESIAASEYMLSDEGQIGFSAVGFSGYFSGYIFKHDVFGAGYYMDHYHHAVDSIETMKREVLAESDHRSEVSVGDMTRLQSKPYHGARIRGEWPDELDNTTYLNGIITKVAELGTHISVRWEDNDTSYSKYPQAGLEIVSGVDEDEKDGDGDRTESGAWEREQFSFTKRRISSFVATNAREQSSASAGSTDASWVLFKALDVQCVCLDLEISHPHALINIIKRFGHYLIPMYSFNIVAHFFPKDQQEKDYWIYQFCRCFTFLCFMLYRNSSLLCRCCF